MDVASVEGTSTDPVVFDDGICASAVVANAIGVPLAIVLVVC